MKVSVTSRINAAEILRKRGLGSSHEAAKFLAGEVRRLCEPYVPMDSGTLKDTAQIVDDADGVAVVYNQPYAHYQYHGEVMAGRAPKSYTGKPIDYHGAPQRGKAWDKRMMSDRGKEVEKSLEAYIRGEIRGEK